MRRPLVAAILTGAILSGCAGAETSAPDAATDPPATTEPAAATTEPAAATTEPVAPAVTRPKSYAKPSSRAWKKIVKNPDNYYGKGYQVWACITQFDAATGAETFRADATFKKLKYWYTADNALFSGTERQLEDFVQGDVVFMKVVSLGPFSYDTQIGGNTTVPLFEVVSISHKGSCD